MGKFDRLSIPKSEEDVRRIVEKEVSSSSETYEEQEQPTPYTISDLTAIAHQLAHVQELLLYIIQTLREVRDSIDTLSISLRRNLRALALAQLLMQTSSPELKKKIIEQLAKDLGINDLKNIYST